MAIRPIAEYALLAHLMPGLASSAQISQCGVLLDIYPRGERASGRGQQQRVGLAGGGVGGVGDDLAVVVDAGRVLDLVAGSGRDEVVEVLQCAVAVDELPADDHAAVVDRGRREVAAQV